MTAINAAWELIGDPTKRAAFDRERPCGRRCRAADGAGAGATSGGAASGGGAGDVSGRGPSGGRPAAVAEPAPRAPQGLAAAVALEPPARAATPRALPHPAARDRLARLDQRSLVRRRRLRPVDADGGRRRRGRSAAGQPLRQPPDVRSLHRLVAGRDRARPTSSTSSGSTGCRSDGRIATRSTPSSDAPGDGARPRSSPRSDAASSAGADGSADPRSADATVNGADRRDRAVRRPAGVAALVAIVARPLRLPDTVALVGVGLAIGAVADAIGVGGSSMSALRSCCSCCCPAWSSRPPTGCGSSSSGAGPRRCSCSRCPASSSRRRSSPSCCWSRRASSRSSWPSSSARWSRRPIPPRSSPRSSACRCRARWRRWSTARACSMTAPASCSSPSRVTAISRAGIVAEDAIVYVRRRRS